MTRAEVEVLRCFEDTEWHLSLWFPRVVREIVGLPREVSDPEAQECIRRLIDSGALEAGTVEGSEFVTCEMAGNGDLYVRAGAAVQIEHS